MTFKEVNNEIKRLKRERHKVMIKEFPVGSKIQYPFGKYIRTATVIDYGYDTDLVVVGVSGKRYRVDARLVV